jgi:DNA-binding response OmpR family regulator
MSHWPRRLRIALIEPDPGGRRALLRRLQALGWDGQDLTATPSPEELVAARPDAALVDLTALGSAGWTFLDRVCVTLPELGILIATPAADPADRVRGLRIGADDWIAKPYDLEEVVARLEAITRRRLRTRERLRPEPLRSEELELRPDQLQAFAFGHSLDLTPREFEVLLALAHEPGQVVRREDLYQRLWGRPMPDGDRTVDAFVFKLRRKLRRAVAGREFIHTHLRVGYRFEPTAVAHAPTGEP